MKKIYFIAMVLLCFITCIATYSYCENKQKYTEQKPSYFVFYNNQNPILYNLSTSNAEWTLEDQSTIIPITGSIIEIHENYAFLRDDNDFTCLLKLNKDSDINIGDKVIAFFSGVDDTLIYPANFHHQYGYLKLN